MRASLGRGLDALAYSGIWTGAAAGALAWATVRAFSAEASLPRSGLVCLLAAAGTVVVYSVDRLRDVERDSATSPSRSAFVSGHRRAMKAVAAIAFVTCLAVATSLPLSVWGLCGGVLVLGLLHRRLKANPTRALTYVSLSWVAIVVGLPALIVGPGLRATTLAVSAIGIGLAIAANAIASDLRGRSFDATAAIRLRTARRCALASWAICLAVPSVRPLALIGAGTWLSLVCFRPDERYGLLVLDGALMLGAIGAALVLGFPAT